MVVGVFLECVVMGFVEWWVGVLDFGGENFIVVVIGEVVEGFVDVEVVFVGIYD